MNIAKDHFEKEWMKKSSDDNRIFRIEYEVGVKMKRELLGRCYGH